MSTHEIISQIQSLPFSERVNIMVEILKSIRTEPMTSKTRDKVIKDKKNVRLRRKSFKIEGFDLGGDVIVDRDEIYSERGT